MALFSTMALKATQGKTPFKYLGVINDGTVNQGYLEYSTDQVLTKNAKFAVDFAYGDFVHIRSCLTNKYWVRSSTNGHWIVAQGVQQVADPTAWTCTLFRMDIDDDKNTKLVHVQSGSTIRILNNDSARSMYLTIDPSATVEAVSLAVDYDTLVALPKFVAFKGSNGLYYKNYSKGNDPYARFSVSHIGDPKIVCEIKNTSDGHICVRAVNHGCSSDMYWVYFGPYQDDLIAWDSDDPESPNQLFAVILIDKNVIALRNLGNNKICKMADVQRSVCKKDRLVATADGAVGDAYLEVVEPFLRRTVNVFEFNLDNARIYDVQPVYSHEHVWDNYSDERQQGSANGVITTTKSRIFGNSINFTLGVKTTFETGIPFIAKGGIETSLSGCYTRKWGEINTETQQVGHTFNVVVKPMKRTIARGVATKGTCDVPFSYVQKDYPADGGPPIVTKLHDGTFTGVNAYNFQDEVRYDDLPREAPTKATTYS